MQFHYFITVAHIATVYRSGQYWNASSEVILKCLATTLPVIFFEWFHVFDGNILRILSGNRSPKGTSLTIKRCDYEDTGHYVCISSIDTEMFSFSTYVTIQGI